MIKKIGIFFLCFGLIFLISCKKKESQVKQKLSINIFSEPQSLDPRKARDLNDINLVRNFFEGLMRIAKDGSIEYGLVENYTISDDSKIYTFKLKNALWSNGEKITSYDFEYTYKKILSPDFVSPNAFLLYMIKNGKKAKEDKIDLDQIGIRTPDEKTLVIELESPCPYFFKLLSCPIFFAINKNIDQKNPLWATEDKDFICNGAFKLSKWNHTDFIEAEKNLFYWGANQVKLEKISMFMLMPDVELNMFEMNKLDMAGSPFSFLVVDSIQNLKKSNRINIQPFYGTSFLRINTQKITDVNFRKALAKSFDRKKIVEHILQGNQKEAIRLVPVEDKMALEIKKEDFFPKKITLTYIALDRAHILAQALQRDWENNLNIKVELRALERKTYYEKLASLDYEIATGSWIADIDDPINFLNIFKYKNSSTNNTGWENEDYIALLERSENVFDENERLKILKKAENLLLNDFPIIPICHMSQNFLKKDNLKNIYIHPSGFIDFKYAYFE